MGFSTSGSLLVIFFATFVAFGSFYTATSNSTEVVSEAGIDTVDQQSAVTDTQIHITDATWDETDERLTVTVNNTGTNVLSLEATELLVNGIYVDGWQSSATVDGIETDLWTPEEQLLIHDDESVSAALDETPERVVIVTETGVTASSRVEVV